MKLSHRLETIASFVRRGSKIADIGTDHGYVPIRLVEEGTAVSALAMDVRKGPLERACAHVREHGLTDRIELRLSDGLAALRPGEADCVIIAGMGGELVIRILEEGKELWDSVGQWVLSPQSDIDEVRRYLLKNGFSIEREVMVEEDGKYYTIMDVTADKMIFDEMIFDEIIFDEIASDGAAGPGSGETVRTAGGWSEAELRYGRYLIAAQDPVLAEYLEKEKRTLSGIEQALKKQEPRTERTEVRLAELSLDLQYIEEAQHEMQRNH